MRITSEPPAYVYEPVGDGEIRVLNLLPDTFEATIQCSLERRALPVSGDTVEVQLREEFTDRMTSDVEFASLLAKMADGSASPSETSYMKNLVQSRCTELVQLQRARNRQTQIGEYEALSYVWGNPEDRVPIFCSGYEIKVTRNLATALKYLRRTESVRQIWADAICINQQDLIEKGQQVQQMGRVYASADKALVWLGEEIQEEEGALEQLPSWLQSLAPHIDWKRAEVVWKSPSSFVFNEEGVNEEEAAWLRLQQTSLPRIMRLFARDWWRRKWIIQELLRAKSAVLICGNQQLDWASIQKLFGDTNTHLAHTYLLIGLLRELPFADEHRHKSQAGMVNAHQLARFASAFHGEDPSRPGLVELVFRSLGFECTVAVDGLYSLLGLAKDLRESKGHHLLAVDYIAGFVDLCIRFTRWFFLNRPRALVPFNHVLGNRKPFNRNEISLNSDLQFQANTERESDPLPPSWTSGFFQPAYSLRRDLVSPLGFQDFDAGGLKRGVRPTAIIHRNEPSTGSAMLELKGRILGTITNILPAIHVGNNTYTLLELRAWTMTILDLISSRASDNRQAFRMFHEFVTCGGEKALILSVQVSSKRRTCVEDTQRYLTAINDLEHHSLDSDPDIRAFVDSIAPATGRGLCTTSSGHIGWVPPVAKEGDQICVFDGAPLLHVIAPCGGGYHNLIGPCYIQGLMFGEAMDLDSEPQTINLY
jgi:Heterokaryon incompatibility protein (HET)